MGGGDACYEAAESKVNEKDKLWDKKKKKGPIKYKGTRTHWVQYCVPFTASSPVQLMQKDRNGFLAKIKPRVLSRKTWSKGKACRL